MAFKILETENFKSNLEEALFWLYSHNLEQSQEFADRKFLELEQEIHNLKNNLQKVPLIGQADEVSGIRRFPVYGGRYLVTWFVNDGIKTITLLEFLDSKHPQSLRGFEIQE